MTKPDGSTTQPAPSASHEQVQVGGSAPMTPSLMGRLFVVPAVLAAVLIGVAVVVVMFGTPAVEKQQNIAQLLQVLERDDGERSLSGTVLWAKDKEYWQAAQELAKQLANQDAVLSEQEIEPTAQRLRAILDRFKSGRADGVEVTTREHFLLLALARLGSPLAIEPIRTRLEDPNSRSRAIALQAIGEMGEVPEARELLPKVLARLNDDDQAVQILACGAVACLAEANDPVVTLALAAKLGGDREVEWNAAMTLARLGSPRGRLVLENMLQRSFWEKIDLDYEERDADGSAHRIFRQYSSREVSQNLVAAIEAAAVLKDAELTTMIRELLKDPSHEVREAARVSVESSGAKELRSSMRMGHMHSSGVGTA